MTPRPTRLCTLLFLMAIFALTAARPPEAAGHGEKHVLVINSYHQGYPWSDNIIEGIQEVFGAADLPVEISYEHMDVQQHDPASLYPLLEELYRRKLADHHQPFDAVIVADNNALEFLLPRRELLVPGVPIVFCGINNYRPEMLAGQENITGVAEDFDLAATIETALQLHPDTRHLAVVSDVTTTGRINYQGFLRVKPMLPPGLEVIELVGLTTNDLIGRLESLPEDTVILRLSWYRDPAGRAFSPAESMRLIRDHSRAPVYTCWGYNIEAGALGGIVVSGHIQGERAAGMALRILKGEPPGAIPVLTESPNVPMFNYEQLERHGISRAPLPFGSIIVNEPDTFYYRYQDFILTVLFLLALQASIICALIINTTRRKRAEAGLRESESRFRTYFELGLIGTAVGNPQGEWIAVNDHLSHMLGYSREELLGRPWAQFTLPDDNPANAELFARMLAGEIDEYTMAKRYVRKDGGIIDAEIAVRALRQPDGTLEYTLAHIQDVTARRQAEKKLADYRGHLEVLVEERTRTLAATNERLHLEVLERRQAEISLRESEEKHRSLVERANDGIFILQGDEFKYVNPALAELLGYTREEMLSLTFDRILPPEVYKLLQDRHRRRVAGEKVPDKYETTVVHRTGESIDVEFNVGIIPYEGRPASLAFVRDIRERRELEEERAKVGRLESIGVLAGGIAHDFNNLLTGILGNVSFARHLAEAGSKTAGLLANAEKITLRARDLTKRLITFAEGGAPVKVKVKLEELLPEFVEFALSGGAVRARFEFADDLRPVEVDPDQLRQLTSILVLNAREAMDEGGEIRIGAENLELAQSNHLSPGRYVRLTVADTGRGIAPADLPRIFDPYFSTKEMGPERGTGLGLAIAYSIVRRHAGHIEMESEVGRGTTVIIHLPAARGHDYRALAELAGQDPGKGRKILLLEDEPEVRDIACDILQFLGYEVEPAATGEQALDLYWQASKNGRPFDAAVIDLTIRGGMGGIATMEELRKLDPEVRAIVASGFANEPAMVDYRRHGFRAAVTKPYHLQDLHAALEKTLAAPADPSQSSR